MNRSASQDSQIRELLNVLEEEATLFASFLSALEEQKVKIVEGDVPGLERVTHELQEKLTSSRILERKRRDLSSRLAESAGMREDVNVTRLLDLVNAADGAALSKMRDTILDLNKRIEESRARNGVLVEKSRQIVRETLKIMSHASAPITNGSTYERDAGVNENSKERPALAMDRRV